MKMFEYKWALKIKPLEMIHNILTSKTNIQNVVSNIMKTWFSHLLQWQLKYFQMLFTNNTNYPAHSANFWNTLKFTFLVKYFLLLYPWEWVFVFILPRVHHCARSLSSQHSIFICVWYNFMNILIYTNWNIFRLHKKITPDHFAI